MVPASFRGEPRYTRGKTRLEQKPPEAISSGEARWSTGGSVERAAGPPLDIRQNALAARSWPPIASEEHRAGPAGSSRCRAQPDLRRSCAIDQGSTEGETDAK
jgi:hypothetical protein